MTVENDFSEFLLWIWASFPLVSSGVKSGNTQVCPCRFTKVVALDVVCGADPGLSCSSSS